MVFTGKNGFYLPERLRTLFYSKIKHLTAFEGGYQPVANLYRTYAFGSAGKQDIAFLEQEIARYK